jgi:hypothetical protein
MIDIPGCSERTNFKKSTLSAPIESTEISVLAAATSGQPKSPQIITKLTSSVTATIAEPSMSVL